jgi:hypothetical protein
VRGDATGNCGLGHGRYIAGEQYALALGGEVFLFIRAATKQFRGEKYVATKIQ